MSLNHEFIMKMEDECFIAYPYGKAKGQRVVLISELAQENLE